MRVFDGHTGCGAVAKMPLDMLAEVSREEHYAVDALFPELGNQIAEEGLPVNRGHRLGHRVRQGPHARAKAATEDGRLVRRRHCLDSIAATVCAIPSRSGISARQPNFPILETLAQ